MVAFRILSVLSRHSGLTQKALISKTALSERTTRDTLKLLVHHGVVIERKDFLDMRVKTYELIHKKLLEEQQ